MKTLAAMILLVPATLAYLAGFTLQVLARSWRNGQKQADEWFEK